MRLTTSLVIMFAAAFCAACGDNIHPAGVADGPIGGGADAPAGDDDAAIDIDAPPGTPDAPPGTPDAPPGTPDASAAALWPHLVITEVDVDGADEFIEIYNPTGATIGLHQYYLSDASNYWRMPEDATNPLTLDGSDFIDRFPSSSSMPAGPCGRSPSTARRSRRATASRPTSRSPTSAARARWRSRSRRPPARSRRP